MPDVTDINKILKDSAYAAIGFGVLGFQKAQVRRRELIEQLAAQGGPMAQLAHHLEALGDQVATQVRTASTGPALADARQQFTEVAKRLDRQVTPFRRQFDDRLNEVEEILPASGREVVRSLRGAAHNGEVALRQAIGLN